MKRSELRQLMSNFDDKQEKILKKIGFEIG